MPAGSTAYGKLGLVSGTLAVMRTKRDAWTRPGTTASKGLRNTFVNRPIINYRIS